MKTLILVLMLMFVAATAQAGSLVITTQEPDGETKTVIDEKFPSSPSKEAASQEAPPEKEQSVSSAPAHKLSGKDTEILALEIEKARLEEELQALRKQFREAIGNPFTQETLKKEIKGVEVRLEALNKDPDAYFKKYFKGKKPKAKRSRAQYCPERFLKGPWPLVIHVFKSSFQAGFWERAKSGYLSPLPHLNIP